MKNIKQLLILCLFLLAGLGSVQAQGANDFSVSDSDARFPTSLNSIKTRMNNDGHFIFAIARNTDRSGGMSNKAYFVYSVLRSDVLGSFSGTGYVTFFDANLNFVERVELSRNETTGNKYADGNSAVTFINQNGEAIGVSTGGSFLYDYEGPWVKPRNQTFAGYTHITRETSKIPQKITQTIKHIYRNKTTGNEIVEEVKHSGIEGQAYTTSPKLKDGYVLVSTPDNANGHLSPFKKGYTYTKHPHPGLKLIYTQLDDNGSMDIKVYWDGYDGGRTPYKHYPEIQTIEPEQSGITFQYGAFLYNISNPYIPRTDEVVYVYETTAVKKHYSRVNPQLRMRVKH